MEFNLKKIKRIHVLYAVCVVLFSFFFITECDLFKEKMSDEERFELEYPDLAKIDKQFSTWDGSHIAFKTIIKNAMHDPSSFKHVSTSHSYTKKNEYITVTMIFRGKNLYGGVVTQTAIARFSIEGAFLGMIE